MPKIYGVDTSKPIEPAHLRDAITECFMQAHNEDWQAKMADELEEFTAEQFEKIKEEEMERIVRGFFNDVGGNFDKPDKESLVAVLKRLKQFAANFHKPEIMDKHHDGVMALVEKL